jgi:hypothetical protein
MYHRMWKLSITRGFEKIVSIHEGLDEGFISQIQGKGTKSQCFQQ